eukprot:gene2851-4921_t
MDQAMLATIRAETRVKTLGLELKHIGCMIVECVSSATTSYSRKCFELEYWKAREGVVSSQLADAQQELNEAIAAQQVFE